MKPWPLLIALGLLAVLGGLVYYTEENPPATDEERVPVVDLQQDDIQAITIHRPEKDPLTVRRSDEEAWKFGEPLSMRVDEFAIDTLIANLTPMNADRVVEEQVTDWQPYGLNGEGSLRVGVETKEGEHTIVFGNDTPTGAGVYARLEGDPRLFTLFSHLKTGFEKEPFDLRDKKLLDVEQDKISRVILKNDGRTLEFGKTGDDKWQILQPQPLRADNFTVGDLARSAQNAEMVSVLEEGPELSGEYSFARPYAIVEVTDEDGTHTITVAKGKEEGSYYARSSDLEGGVFEVSQTFAEGLNKELKDFRNKKLFDFGFQDPSKLELRDGDTRLTIAKKDDNWVAASDGDRELDSEKVQSVIDSLRNLTAKEFTSDEAAEQAKYGLGNPAIEAQVTPSEDGKQQEKVVISSPENDRVYAAIPGAPTTYEIEKSAAEEIQRSIEDVLKPAEPEDEEGKEEDSGE